MTEGTCGRYDVIPRELTLKEGFLHLSPIVELSQIQKNVVTTKHSSGTRVLLRQGSQVQALLNCSVASAISDIDADVTDIFPSGTNVSLEVLATADGVQLARYGFALDTRTFFIEHKGLKTTVCLFSPSLPSSLPVSAKRMRGCGSQSSHLQTAYPTMPPWVSMVVMVDGGVVESFTDSGFSMASSPKQVPVPNGAVTTRSFLPADAPFAM